MRRELFYVNISHLDDTALAFFGYTLIDEDTDQKLYLCYDGEEHIVDKRNPHLLVEDVNDANAMKATKGLFFSREP